MTTGGSLLETDYSSVDLQAAQTAANKKAEKLHQKAWKFIKKVCPFQK